VEGQQGRRLPADGERRVHDQLTSRLFPLVALGLGAIAAAPPAPRPFAVQRLAPGVYLVPGDTGRGSEGRPNAGFVVTSRGVVVIDALASPEDGERLLRSVRSVSRAPIRWLVLTHHHPDHTFGAIVFRRAGAKVMAHPDLRTLASEGGDDALLAEWVRVVGLPAMVGFQFADTPDVAVRGTDTLRLGGRSLVVTHPGAAHTPGDLMVWLPAERILFAGDILVEDGVTMMVDGNSTALLRALAAIDSLHPRIVVPGHGRLPPDPAALVDRTRRYVTTLRDSMRTAVEQGLSMRKAMADLPPADEQRPVSLPSRLRRNAVRVYLEMEKAVMGLSDSTGADGEP
jgi:glyoxylase-like metal-dependent hydrolase (beta-lactamase superfamily II)